MDYTMILEQNQDYHEILGTKTYQDKKEKQIMTQYSEKSYKMASDNTKYNDDGKAVISENDEWRDEKEWDEVFGLMQNEQKNPQQ